MLLKIFEFLFYKSEELCHIILHVARQPSLNATYQEGEGREEKIFFFLMEELIGGRDKRREERERRMRQPTRG